MFCARFSLPLQYGSDFCELRRCFVYCSIARLRSRVVSNAANEVSLLEALMGDKSHF